MADIIKQTQPYELLVRWNDRGHLNGAHYQTLTTYREGDVVVAAQADDPVPVAVAGNNGFPLDAILTPEHLAPLSAVNAANAERDAAIFERDAALAERNAVMAELRAARGAIETL